MKFFTTLFVALVAVHASTQSPIEETMTPSKLVADIVDFVVAETSLLLVQPLTIWAKELDSKKDNYEKVIVNQLTEVTTKINEVAISLLKAASVDASDNGKTFINCLSGEQAGVNALIGAMNQQMVDCAFVNYENATVLVKTVLYQTGVALDNLLVLSSTLANCTKGDYLCLAFFSQDVILQFQFSVLTAIADLGAVRDLLYSVVESTQNCPLTEDVKEHVVDVLNNIATCVHNKH
ncbi:unnamed protein product [Ceutorhynchus assimilis]|uniref:Secreted protein n=1 Tax=Ceutorhynchus assimilis TaxID=467358 RepID=A0A9N9QNE8_9CUCU|nr:unnamed protein product [Ceutorhynchus assimilis]